MISMRALAESLVLGAMLLGVGSASLAEEERRFAKDSSRCPYLTRPAVEKCGARLNYHSGGQALCHNDRLMHCFAGQWNDRGACSAVGQGYPQAADVERSVFNTDIYESDGDDCDGPSDKGGPAAPGDSDSPDSGAAATPGGSGSTSILQGESPVSQQIENEERRLQQVREALEREDAAKRGRAAGAGGSAGAGLSQSGSGSSQCSEMRRGLAMVDEQIRSLEDATRALGTGRAEVNRLIRIRADMRQQYSDAGCQ